MTNTARASLVWREIPGLHPDNCTQTHQCQTKCFGSADATRRRSNFACISLPEKTEEKGFSPTSAQLLKHPLAMVALVPKDAALFAAGAIAGAAAKTVTAPLDRIKLLMQTHGLRAGQEGARKGIDLLRLSNTTMWSNLLKFNLGLHIDREGRGIKRVIRIIPYSAVQLFAYETYKKLFRGKDGELSVIGRLAAGACAGMTSTFVTYPLDVLRLRVKKALPEKYQKRTETSLATALVSATVATLMCYPLDTVRRQMQMKGTPYATVLDAFPVEEIKLRVIRLYDPGLYFLLYNQASAVVIKYVVEGDSQIRTILEEPLPGTKVLQDSYSMGTDKALTWLPKVIKDFVLLQASQVAVGVGSLSGTAAAASAAAIRWVSKDGIGAVGRLFIGGRFGNLFDDDPKQWRCMQTSLAAQEGFASHVLKGQYMFVIWCILLKNIIFCCSIFDLSTQLYPAYFLPLASLGNLAKAVGRGLRDPSFRVIQNHFAISGNLGEVSAKEEVWEVAAELVGLALGILALINLKRARILVNSHILYRKVPGISDCNRMENILVWERFLRPRITFGVTLEEMVTGKKRGSMVETDFLMGLFERGLRDELQHLMSAGVRISIIGDVSKLLKPLQVLLADAMETTINNSKLHLIIAVNYSGQNDIVQACQKLAVKVKDGLIEPEEINEFLVERELETNCTDFPYPDLLIRTSGEIRISNFLLWQLAYTELYFAHSLWPDFGEDEFREAVCSFQIRQRRYGGQKS
ncbi:UNVERIFIED_CONTAM: putative envelope ADP,ATP carrier protein, chloroplastic [Sesamum calycinum]|uniref:Envelope ADP,ATP carrier protein, chloroplastic n=1 Tax=Sesamum calycinum TaxID=2727403 RepID=A0AAW2NVQ3_9LAMI